jgi:hypothetical protein
MTITCDTRFGKHNESDIFPALSCFPPVNTYVFRNFQRIQSYAFENITFPENQSFAIKLINISTIDNDAFSSSLMMPDSSNLSIDIENLNSSSSITIKPNAFNHIKIDRLRFININNFNGRPIFDTNCLGSNSDINVLIFEQCGITGFSNIIRTVADVNYLSIVNSPGLTQLTPISLPSFLATSKSLEISNTSLKIINAHTFQAWSLILEDLILSNNSNLEIFPSNIVDGVLMKLNRLDLSYNAIKTLDPDYNWFAYSYTKHLLLRNQQLDLFLKTNILKTLTELEIIDFSDGFISDNDDDLMKTFFPSIPNLISIDVSNTNLTENMIIDILTRISETTQHFTNIRLLGHSLTDENFCAYFKIFKNAPNLLNLQLDDAHECNCVVDLFYSDKLQQDLTNDSPLLPLCFFNSTRPHCNVNNQLSLSKCNINGQNPDNSDDNIGNYAFGAVVGGLTIVVFILLLLGFTVVYRIRRRRNTDLSMEQPVENPLAAIIEERLQNS